ncbi:unnamed protein product [Discula destructiva]
MAPTTSLTRTLPAGALICRGSLQARPFQACMQRRWIGLKYLEKMRKADEEWKAQAQEIAEGKRKNLFDELDERGFIKDVVGRTKDQVRELMRVKRVKAYAGVDPTAPSLHLGHLVTFMPLFWMYRHGYGAITVIGSSTARIGDPSGRTKDRPALSSSELTQNLAGVHHQLKNLWQSLEANNRRFGYHWEWAWQRGIVNNNAWWNKAPMLEILKRLGNHVRLGPMLGRDNVKTRLNEGSGMSVSEFLYPLMQGWDWFELFKQRGIQMQIGGSDQYGNILAGIECVKHCVKSEPDPALQLPSGEYDQPLGFTVPLLTDASGAKFGKSAGNAIWLDPFQTTPYDMYGYLVRRPDDQIERLLKLFTFHPLEQIAKVMAEHTADPRQRVAQHLLAHEVVWLVHGKAIADRARWEHQTMYGASTGTATPSGPAPQDPEQYSSPAIVTATNRPRIDLKLPRSLLDQSLARIMYASGLASSISDGDRSIKAGGVYLGGAPGGRGAKYQYGMIAEQLQFVPIKAWNPALNVKFLIDGNVMLIRKGKHNLRCVEFVSEEEFAALGVEYPGQPNTGAFRKAVGKLNQSIQAARSTRQEKGELSEDDKIDDSFGGSVSRPVSEHGLRSIRRSVQQADKEGIVKNDFEKW